MLRSGTAGCVSRRWLLALVLVLEASYNGMAWVRGGECRVQLALSTARYRFSRRFNRPRDPLFVRWCSAKRLFTFSAGFFCQLRPRPLLAGPPPCMRGSCTQAGQVGGRFAQNTGQKPKARTRGDRESYDNAWPGGHPVSELRVIAIATDIETAVECLAPQPPAGGAVSPLQTPASQGPGSAGRGEKRSGLLVQTGFTILTPCANPPRLSPWRRLFGGGPGRGRTPSAEANTKREIERKPIRRLSASVSAPERALAWCYFQAHKA